MQWEHRNDAQTCFYQGEVVTNVRLGIMDCSLYGWKPTDGTRFCLGTALLRQRNLCDHGDHASRTAGGRYCSGGPFDDRCSNFRSGGLSFFYFL